jgi:hypothetical protein
VPCTRRPRAVFIWRGQVQCWVCLWRYETSVPVPDETLPNNQECPKGCGMTCEPVDRDDVEVV